MKLPFKNIHRMLVKCRCHLNTVFSEYRFWRSCPLHIFRLQVTRSCPLLLFFIFSFKRSCPKYFFYIALPLKIPYIIFRFPLILFRRHFAKVSVYFNYLHLPLFSEHRFRELTFNYVQFAGKLKLPFNYFQDTDGWSCPLIMFFTAAPDVSFEKQDDIFRAAVVFWWFSYWTRTEALDCFSLE
jgi:hypothetical protein